jgi:hypothetical protein
MRRAMMVLLALLLPALAQAQQVGGGSGIYSSSQASASVNPATTIEQTEEFMTGGATSTTLGSIGLSITAIATGTLGFPAGEADHPGLVRLNSHATNDNSGADVSWPGGAVGPALLTRDWSIDVLFKPGSNSTAITNAAWYVGVTSTTADPAAATVGIWARFNSDLTDAKWMFQICNAAGAAGCASADDAANTTVIASTVTPSANTWYRVRMRQVAVGVGGTRTIYARINDENEVSFCASGCTDVLTGVPTSGNIVPSVFYLTRTTTGVLSGDLDYIYFKQSGLVRY